MWFGRSLLFMLIGIFAINICHVHFGGSPYVVADSDEDVLEDDGIVETDTEEKQRPTAEGDPASALTEQEQPATDEMPDGLPRPHPSIEARLLFTDPSDIGVIPRPSAIVPLEVPVGRPVRVLVAFKHLGVENPPKEFTLDAIAGALRYPSDFSYYIQNFTALRLDRTIESKREATIAYAFMPATQLNGRPYGLTVRVFYHDTDGQTYVQTVMNETVQLVEWEGPGANRWLDTEAIFMYLVVTGLCVLLLLCLYHLWQSYAPTKMRASKKSGIFSSHSGSSKSQSSGNAAGDAGDNGAVQAVMAAARAKGIDLDWIPKEHLIREGNRRSPPRQSPKQRKARRDMSSQDEDD